jgi:putative RNA 2'-phosphotransferase
MLNAPFLHPMPKRNHQFKVEDLCRLLVYILGRRPYEFGLVPDKKGIVSYKELLQAIHEEPGWGYVRRSHINEVLLGKDRTLFDAEEKSIRVLERRWELDLESPAESLPKILLAPVRRKAHGVAMEKGLRAPEGRQLVLCQDRDMALRIGKRRDHEPVLLEIQAQEAQRGGVLFYPFGDLFLSPQIPAGCISGPPVSKEVMETRKAMETKKEKVKEKPHGIPGGTFPLDISRDPDPYRRAKGKKRKGWKEEARKTRRRKERGRDKGIP